MYGSAWLAVYIRPVQPIQASSVGIQQATNFFMGTLSSLQVQLRNVTFQHQQRNVCNSQTAICAMSSTVNQLSYFTFKMCFRGM